MIFRGQYRLPGCETCSNGKLNFIEDSTSNGSFVEPESSPQSLNEDITIEENSNRIFDDDEVFITFSASENDSEEESSSEVMTANDKNFINSIEKKACKTSKNT